MKKRHGKMFNTIHLHYQSKCEKEELKQKRIALLLLSLFCFFVCAFIVTYVTVYFVNVVPLINDTNQLNALVANYTHTYQNDYLASVAWANEPKIAQSLQTDANSYIAWLHAHPNASHAEIVQRYNAYIAEIKQLNILQTLTNGRLSTAEAKTLDVYTAQYALLMTKIQHASTLYHGILGVLGVIEIVGIGSFGISTLIIVNYDSNFGFFVFLIFFIAISMSVSVMSLCLALGNNFFGVYNPQSMPTYQTATFATGYILANENGAFVLPTGTMANRVAGNQEVQNVMSVANHDVYDNATFAINTAKTAPIISIIFGNTVYANGFSVVSENNTSVISAIVHQANMDNPAEGGATILTVNGLIEQTKSYNWFPLTANIDNNISFYG